jgi:hypothetical protein
MLQTQEEKISMDRENPKHQPRENDIRQKSEEVMKVNTAGSETVMTSMTRCAGRREKEGLERQVVGHITSGQNS